MQNLYALFHNMVKKTQWTQYVQQLIKIKSINSPESEDLALAYPHIQHFEGQLHTLHAPSFLHSGYCLEISIMI